MNFILIILIFITLFFTIYYFCKKSEKLEITQNKITDINMNPNKFNYSKSYNSTVINTNKTMEEAELDSYKNPIKWNCVNQCKNIIDPSLKRVCIDVCLNKKIIDKKS